jgi:DNA-binding beta-propeller fold protein YncE
MVQVYHRWGGWAKILLVLLFVSGCAASPTGLLRPNGVAVAPDGSLYVMDRGHNRVVHLSATGRVLDTFGRLGRGPDDIYSGWDIALDSGGNIYICHHIFDIQGSYRSHDGVKVFTPDGRFWRELGAQDYAYNDDLQANTPYGLAIDRQDRVYVADFDANRVRVFDAEGQTIARFFGEKGRQLGQFNGLSHVAVDSQRHLLYATDEANSRVQQFELIETAPDELAATPRLSFGSYGREPGQFAYPQDIAVDESSGRVYVADMANRRVQAFDPDGQYLTEFSPGEDWQVIGLDVGPDGAIYATDTLNNAILVFEPDGQLRDRIEAQP